MIDNAEETELARALAAIEKMRTENDSIQTDLEKAESDRDGFERDAADAESEKEDAEAQVEALQDELDRIHEGIGMRSIIERAWAADPIATENDLQSANLGEVCSTLRVDHQSGRLNFQVQS